MMNSHLLGDETNRIYGKRESMRINPSIHKNRDHQVVRVLVIIGRINDMISI